jgi:hypothetical protein
VSRIARVAAFAAVAAHIAILVAVLVFGAAAFDFAMRAYLRAHPEVVVEALDLYEQRAEANAEQRRR